MQTPKKVVITGNDSVVIQWITKQMSEHIKTVRQYSNNQIYNMWFSLSLKS